MRFFRTAFFMLALAPNFLRAQTPPQISPEAAAQMIMRPQPAVDNSQLENVSATAEFDPPVVRPGEKTFYRVAVSATQNSIEWPDEISAPPELKFGATARGQLMQPDGVRFQPLTEFIYEITPMATGHFAISNFIVSVGGRSVEIPAASVDVETDAVTQPARKLSLEVSVTNLFFGQPFRVRVILPATPENQVEALRDVQFNGGGFLTDKLATRQSIEPVSCDGQLKPAAIYETVATPLAAGTLTLSAQAFTTAIMSVPISIHAPITISGGPVKNVLLASDAVAINVRPLPSENEPPSFTGAIGKFFYDPPQLSTNRLRVGEPAHLKIIFHGEGELTRFVPPALPRARDWQIIADELPATGFTLIPLTDDAHETPAIPFSYFDPATGNYIDLTIPSLPVTVIGEGLPVQLPVFDDENKSAAPLKLSGLAKTPGKTVASLKPLQLRGWFVAVQLLPTMGFFALWQWDRRRRFLEAHPEIVRRRKAKRDLRREKLKLQNAFAIGDATAFVWHAADAMKIAVAPHYPANPNALVYADVLAQMDAAEQNGRARETARKIFAAADAQFSLVPQTQANLLKLKSEVEAVLLKLEEKL
jgi:hypothetical protein